MLVSQQLTLGYAALVGLDGVIDYLKRGRMKRAKRKRGSKPSLISIGGNKSSLISSGVSTTLLYYVYRKLPSNPKGASCIGLGLSGLHLGTKGVRFLISGKVFPAGILAGVSLVMVGGYAHGIVRSFH